jgi:hypothetical protein
MLCADLVDVRWQDRSGREWSTAANLEDISVAGACLQLDGPIPPETRLGIQHAQGEFQGIVRYCVFREIGYFIGVQFAPDTQWSPQQFEPAHLLDLRELVLNRAEKAAREARHRATQAD